MNEFAEIFYYEGEPFKIVGGISHTLLLTKEFIKNKKEYKIRLFACG